MGETVVKQPDCPEAHADETRPRHFAVVGLSTIAVGLFTLALGVVLGLMKYSSPLETGIRSALEMTASNAAGIQLEGGEQIVSVARYPIPGPGAYILGQQATWIGLLIAFVGLAMYLRSRVGAVEPEEAVARVADVEAGGEPFDQE